MFFKQERKSAAALSALMSQTKDTMVCFEFKEPIDLNAPQKTIDAQLRDAIVVDASRAFTRYFGIKNREDVVGSNLSELFGGKIPDWFQHYGQEVEDRNFENIERIVMVPIADREVPMKIYMQNIFIDDRLRSQWVTLRDVSQETESARKIAENERLSRLALETVGLQTFSLNFKPDGSGQTDGDVHINNHPITDWWEAIHPEDRVLLQESFGDFYSGKTERLHSLFRLQDESGNVTSWRESWTVVSERDADGRALRLTGVVMDRTQSQALEKRLVAGQRLESLGVMAGGIAHDFNNLLMSITGTLDVLMNEQPSLINEFKVIDDAARQAAGLCDQLLTYAGRGSGNLSPLNLSDTISAIKDLISVSLDKDAHLTIVANDNCWIRGDAGQIAQVLMNLTKNASDAIAGESGQIHIRVNDAKYEDSWRANYHLGQTLIPGDYIALEVEDTGTGIAEDELDQLFDPFFTTKFTGRGLGLAVVMGVVRGHGGAIRVESVKGAGTCVTVVLPRQAEPESETVSSEQTSSTLSGSILVVDDDSSVRTMAAGLLKSIGMQVHTVGSGHEAIAEFNKQPDQYDALMIDVTMPEMDGVETASQILDKHPGARIIMCSGYSNIVMPNKLAEEVTFLQKPYRLQQLKEKLDSVITA